MMALLPPEVSIVCGCSSMFSMLRTTMRFQNPLKSGLPSGVRGGVNVFIFSSAQRWKAVGSSEQPADCPYGRIGVGPEPGGGDANGARWLNSDGWSAMTTPNAVMRAKRIRIRGILAESHRVCASRSRATGCARVRVALRVVRESDSGDGLTQGGQICAR